MLSKEDLLVCNEPPNIRDVSLTLYKEFAEDYLIGKVFHYRFADGTTLNVQFTEWGIYHMLAMQHINGKINRNRFFEQIADGLSFEDLQQTDALKYRFKNFKKRITMFACTYQSLKRGKVFYIPSGKVQGTSSVQMDYIVHNELNNVSPTGITKNGLNIGIRNENGLFVPLTILISRNSNIEEYIKTAERKIVKSLEIKDKFGTVVDSVYY